jgi:Capsular polysaccharide biosynthesis protein
MDNELDLRQVFLILRKKLWLLILLTFLLGGLSFFASEYFIPPKYSTTASLYVYNETSRTDGITSTDLATSQKLVQTYIVILSSNSVLDKVSEQLGGVYTADQIRKMLSASPIDDTEAFRITITCKNPKDAKEIANTIADVAPTEIIRVVKAGSVEVIDYATLPTEQSSPNVARNTVIGALIGLILAIAVAIITAMFDTVIRSEEDLTAAFSIPVIGIIPNMDDSDS